MEFMFQPIYKYIVYFIIILSFLEFYSNIPSSNYVIICIFFTVLVYILDVMMLADVPLFISTQKYDSIDNFDDNNDIDD